MSSQNSGIASLFEFSEGVPRLINRFCKLCLKAGETNSLSEIDAQVVSTVANQFQPSRLLQGLVDAGASKKARDQQNLEEEPAGDNTESPIPGNQKIEAQTEGLDTGPDIGKAPEPSVVPEKSPNDLNIDEISSPQASIPESENHPIEGTHAIKSDCRVAVETHLDERPTYAEPGLDPETQAFQPAELSFSEDQNTEPPVGVDQNIEPESESFDTQSGTEKDQAPLVASEEHPADHDFVNGYSSDESIPGSESHDIEGTHAIKSDCRVSVEAQLDEKPTHPEPGSESDIDFSDRLPSESRTYQPVEGSPSQNNSTEPQTQVDQDSRAESESLDAESITGEDRDALVIPEERPADQDFEGVPASRESISGSESPPVEGTQATKSDHQVPVGTLLDEKLPNQEQGLKPDMDFFDRLRSELQTSERSLSQDNNTESPTHVEQNIGSGSEGLDAVKKTESNSEPEFVPAQNGKPASDQIVSSDAAEDLRDQSETAEDAETPVVPPSSDNGRITIEWERKRVGSEANGKGGRKAHSSDENISRLRRRIAKDGKPAPAPKRWVRNLFRGALW